MLLWLAVMIHLNLTLVLIFSPTQEVGMVLPFKSMLEMVPLVGEILSVEQALTTSQESPRILRVTTRIRDGLQVRH